ncbi:hypothetical protein THMIRHAS_02130 [Thiosulfatimonas sediminis]|uniref:Uncharacterized protein n=1 Tax=Thiosulfatimonas sediminis TaxID=2675054 RepID=A0A6F8PS76_9GAMM|nr:ribonuclease [Thiosulfatimonas sediminis]BBP44840.1 hypothetical protein THMIRHAS_02130 [Thiosulfatimonas sediminis]
MHYFLALFFVFALSFNVHAKCQIDDAWLNPNYDHQIDYQNTEVATDFFLLMFSNSKKFCEQMARKGQTDKVKFQCASGNDFGWVVHGLWGESENAYIRGDYKGHPRFCQGDLPKVTLAELKPYLCMSPGTRLLQGEWEKHGACDFPSFTAYYQKTQALYQRYTMPPAELKPKAAMQWMKKQHPELKDLWMHVDHKEFGICFDKQFQVMSCPKQRR